MTHTQVTPPLYFRFVHDIHSSPIHAIVVHYRSARTRGETGPVFVEKASEVRCVAGEIAPSYLVRVTWELFAYAVELHIHSVVMWTRDLVGTTGIRRKNTKRFIARKQGIEHV